MPIAHMVEWAYRLLGPYGMKVPQLTPSRIRLLSCSRSFNCSKAKDLLGYAPVVPLQVLSCFIRKDQQVAKRKKGIEKKRKDKKGARGKSEETFVLPCGSIFLIVLNVVA